MEDDEKPKAMGQVIQIDEARIKDHLGEMVRGTVEEALNAMLDAEADRLCGAGRYERTEGRRDTRAGSYERSLDTKAGPVTLKMPKLRQQTFETAIIERYQRRESSVEEALIAPLGGAALACRAMDVSGGCLRTPCRGHHRGALGHSRQSGHSLRPQQEDLRQDRRMASSQDRRQPPLCLPGRDRHEAEVGGRSA